MYIIKIWHCGELIKTLEIADKKKVAKVFLMYDKTLMCYPQLVVDGASYTIEKAYKKLGIKAKDHI